MEFKEGDIVKLNLNATDYWSEWFLKKEGNSIFKIIRLYDNNRYKIKSKNDDPNEYTITNKHGIIKFSVHLPDELFIL